MLELRIKMSMELNIAYITSKPCDWLSSLAITFALAAII